MTVLHSYEEYSYYGFLDGVFVVLMCLTLMFAIFCIVAIKEDKLSWVMGFALLAVISAIGAYNLSDIITETHTEYEVIIHDYNEVYEQGYEIIEERGDITVIKKEETE